MLCHLSSPPLPSSLQPSSSPHLLAPPPLFCLACASFSCYSLNCFITILGIIPAQSLAFILGTIGNCLRLCTSPEELRERRSCRRCCSCCDVLIASSVLNAIAVLLLCVGTLFTLWFRDAISMEVAAAVPLAVAQLLLAGLLLALIRSNMLLQERLSRRTAASNEEILNAAAPLAVAVPAAVGVPIGQPVEAC